MSDEELYEDFLRWAEDGDEFAVEFQRVEVRHRRVKVRADCGHWIDGSLAKQTPYRYSVWKLRGEKGVQQRIDCEDCARKDNRY